MFRPDDILARLHERPFKPFRIIASEGQRFEIPHPDLVLVGHRDLVVGFPSAQNPRIYDGLTRLALVHIVALEDLPVPASTPDGQS